MDGGRVYRSHIADSADSWVTGCVGEQGRMGAFFAKFRRQPAQSNDAPRGPSRVTDQDKAVFVRSHVE